MLVLNRRRNDNFHCNLAVVGLERAYVRLPHVLERQELSLNFLSKRVLSLILEKHLFVLEYIPVFLKILEYFLNCSFKNY